MAKGMIIRNCTISNFKLELKMSGLESRSQYGFGIPKFQDLVCHQ